MKKTMLRRRVAGLLATTFIIAVDGLAGGTTAQTTGQAMAAPELPPIQVDKPKPTAPSRQARPATQSGSSVVRRPAAAAPATPQAAPVTSQSSSNGTVGVYSNSTSVATKVNTPLVNIPQSINVVTRNFIQDQAFPGLTDVTRYVPGVAIHQGEGNRDELVIRGVSSSANFFVNGFRDDVQYFRDLYNTQTIEVLKGPSMLTFGRGSGGGLVNRTLKEADFTRVYEATAQTGSFGDRRITLDAGQAVTQNFAARLNMMYEGSDTFRDFGKLERWGINPTFTFRPGDSTTVKLSYEYFHDNRTPDRGNPSQALSATAPAATSHNPARPFAPNGDITTFYGSPDLNQSKVNVQAVMAVVDHDFENGLTVKNSTRFTDYEKFYQNIYPGNGPLSGAVNPAQTAMNLAAYNNQTDRQNTFNQTDFIYKAHTGWVRHTLAFGTEFGHQTGTGFRNTGFFPNGTNTTIVDPFNPTYFGRVNFIHQATDTNTKYSLEVGSAYVRDTIDITSWLQLVGGVRFDRFALDATDQNTSIARARTDNLWSPQGAIILKPMTNVSFYGSYAVSYLPSSGDQFSSLNDGTLILEPQKFDNKEVGFKWNIDPRLLYTAAVYELKRTNVPIADPNNPGFFLPSGSHRIRGFDTSLAGYVTPNWQSSLGYAYTDARITSDTSLTVVAGNRVQLVPYNQFSFWNKYQINPIWAASVGVIYLSDFYASSDNSVKLPGFFRVDAGLFAKINENWKLQLNVENVFDKGYWASADGNNNLAPGAPRTYRVSATATF